MAYEVKECMNCIHASGVVETSDEWLQCKCELDGRMHDVVSVCGKHEKENGNV